MSISRFVSRELDLSLLTVVCLTTLLGITMIYSATYNWDLGTAGKVYEKQIAWSLIALLGLVLTVAIPLKFYYAFAYILYGIAMFLLVLVLELGDRRWFNLGPIHVQPSELAKIATVLALARYLSKRNLNLNQVRTFVAPVLLVFIPTLLVYKQPDLGTALVFGAILLPILFWAGLRAVVLFLIISPALSLICAFNSYTLGVLILIAGGEYASLRTSCVYCEVTSTEEISGGI